MLARGHERSWVFKLDMISFEALYQSVTRNRTRELEDLTWAMHYASQAETKELRKYAVARFGGKAAASKGLADLERDIGGGI